eukprot:12541734-Ditylum_brightwellii.AAC.1
MEDVMSQAKILGYEHENSTMNQGKPESSPFNLQNIFPDIGFDSELLPVPTWHLRHSDITTCVDAMKYNHGEECHKSTAAMPLKLKSMYGGCDITGKEPGL